VGFALLPECGLMAESGHSNTHCKLGC
ncbi:uncharacterized protein METZ01_LOCUS291517, partial [marine metagenome]